MANGNDTTRLNGVYQRILILTANANSTTMEGDSGGPLFAVSERQQVNVIPLGVILGDNYSTSQIINTNATRNNVVTSVKGIERLFGG